MHSAFCDEETFMHIDDTLGHTSHRTEVDSARLRLIADALARLRFGSIQLTVHEGKLVQMEVTEKTRLPA
jgi:hypothetical protein